MPVVTAAVLGLSACGQQYGVVESYSLENDGTTIVAEIAGCGDSVSRTIVQGSEAVELTVADIDDPECTTRMFVDLAAPLGERDVVDGHTDEVVPAA